MAAQVFRHNFHDGLLMGFSLGPRRELTLEMVLDPVWNSGTASTVKVRFGGIENFEEAASRFRSLPGPRQPGESLAEIESLKFAEKGRRQVILELSGHAAIEVRCRNVAEG
ncbi:MAG: hypothetical protein JWM59_2302 [Verrucomicrobiales bacterium]|nr:hypothetical protein [Verrucomicrobiales bacterium]